MSRVVAIFYVELESCEFGKEFFIKWDSVINNLINLLKTNQNSNKTQKHTHE